MSSSSSSSGAPSSIAPTYGRGLWIHRSEQSRQKPPALVGFAFRLTAYGASQMPNEIFRYQEHVFDPMTGTTRLEYDGVCSAQDLEEWPIGEADKSKFPRYCRLDFVGLLCRSETEANMAIQAIMTEANNLVTAMNFYDDLVDAGSVAVGDPPPASYPASSSLSAAA